MLWLYLLTWMASEPEGARILGIFPTPSISHQLPFHAIMKALAARGHQVTVITTDLLKEPVPNYTEIDISFSYKTLRSVDFTNMPETSGYHVTSQLISIFCKINDEQLSSPQIQQFIKSTSNNSYDLAFLEVLAFQSYHGLIHLLGSPPVIGITSLGLSYAVTDAVGSTTNPSFIPDSFLHYSDHMTFYERLQNTIFWLWLRYKIHLELYPVQENIMRKHFGAAPPPVYEAERNMSLLMIGTDWIFGYPAPLAPAVITFHSLHVKTKPDPLSQDLQKFLDEATDGVIYFSLGSNIFSNHMPEKKRRIFIEAFSELPQKVLWKWEDDALPEKPPNVRIRKWMPQQDILAHPNVKLFITQCGLQSLQESVHHGVPLLGIPFMFDQKYNARKIQEAGIGLQLSFQDIARESLLNAVKEILHNTSYRDNAKKLSVLSRDHPQSSLEKTVWWTEYVLRHKGTKHLRSAALDLEWYQYILLDVAAFLLVLTLTMIFILYFMCKTLFHCVMRKTEIKSKYD